MKNFKITTIQVLIFVCGILFTQCDDSLETEVYGELPADGEVGVGTMEGLLNGVYADFQMNGAQGRDVIYIMEFSADHVWNERGGLSNSSVFFLNWNWDAQNPSWLRTTLWTRPYSAIRNANFFLEVVDGSELTDAQKSQWKAEVRFARATMYAFLYNWFGTVPLRTTSSDDPNLGRSDEAQLLSFIETELAEAVPDLPTVAEQAGRATRGAAYGILMKHYLNTKNWAGVVQYADLIDDLGLYSLYSAGTNPHRDLFTIAFEESEQETIFSFPAIAAIMPTANAVMSHSYPEGDYASFVGGDDVKLPNQSISGTKNRVYDDFFNSFDPADDRKKQLISQYINTDGATITQEANKNSSFKYWPDPNMNIWASGHDFKIVRYADVLLSKAEALNEINGPTQQAIDLINQVRSRAKAPDISLAEFGSKEALRDRILDERGWEFHFEGKRREDLIRHGKFVSSKKNHPVHPAADAADFRVLFPIPQAELDVNTNLTQNPGYGQ